MNFNSEQDYERWLKAVNPLYSKGFKCVGGWIFEKNGIQYDLSAADLNQLDLIEKKGLFLVKNIGEFFH